MSSKSASNGMPDMNGIPIEATDQERIRALVDTLSAYIEVLSRRRCQNGIVRRRNADHKNVRRMSRLPAFTPYAARLGRRDGAPILSAIEKRCCRVR